MMIVLTGALSGIRSDNKLMRGEECFSFQVITHLLWEILLPELKAPAQRYFKLKFVYILFSGTVVRYRFKSIWKICTLYYRIKACLSAAPMPSFPFTISHPNIHLF